MKTVRASVISITAGPEPGFRAHIMTRTTSAARAPSRRRAVAMVTCCVLAVSPVLAFAQAGAGRVMISVREVDAGLRSTVTIDGGGALAARGATVVSTSQARDANRDADVVQRIAVGNGMTGWISAASPGYVPEVVGTGRGRPAARVGAGTGAASGSDTASRGDGLRVEAAAVDDRSGFTVVPHRLKGDRVSVDVTRVRDRNSAWGGGEADRLSTKVEGRLGEWLPLAGLDAGMHGGVGAAQESSADDAARRRFEIRVDDMPPR